ncbi:hypothetical protein EMPS_08308 [Entomortierella parvispora]|uniref:Uncharacterized protein n=1 Tax=Entomortierella parvispora TaxID=205924 RepID=A0A9P3HG61_9FUNG|nr:hypothetical protein EMPS_08308 [Entomortierella parvispora]
MDSPQRHVLSSGDDNSDSDGGLSGYGDAGYDADDQQASSDSELVSHPSDNEGPLRSLSASPSPVPSTSYHQHNMHLAETRSLRYSRDDDEDTDSQEDEDDEEDDDDTPLPSFSLSHHDHELEQLVPASRDLDDFCLVYSSDLDSPSRPQSALSHLSDQDHPGGPMQFIYPSMVISPSPPPRSAPVRRTSASSRSVASSSSVQPQTPEAASSQSETLAFLSSADTSSRTVAKPSPPQGSTGPLESSTEPPHEPTLATHDIPLPKVAPSHRVTLETTHTATAEPAPSAPDQETKSVKSSSALETHSAGVDSVPVVNAKKQTNTSTTISTISSHKRTMRAVPEAHPHQEELSRVSSEDEKIWVASPMPTISEAEASRLIPRVSTPPVPATKLIISESLPPVLEPPSRNRVRTVVIGLAGMGLYVLVLFAAYSYGAWTARPAHAEISHIRYAHDHRLAVVQLQTYTANLKLKKNTRPEEYHIRVLTSDTPWRLEDAPPHATLFGEPIVGDFLSGTYIYVRSLHRPSRSQQNRRPLALLQQESPWACSDVSYFLHVWFANGTRISDHAPEIFTTRSNGLGKPLFCLTRRPPVLQEPLGSANVVEDKESQGFEDDDDDDDEADYIRYWTERWHDMSTAATTNILGLSKRVSWTEIQKSVTEVPYIIEQALMYTRRTVVMAAEYFVRWAQAFLFESEGSFQQRTNSAFERARANAKTTKGKATYRLRALAEKMHLVIPEQNPYEQTMAAFKEQLRQIQRTVNEGAEKLSTRNVLQVADDILLEAEAGVEAIMQSKTMKKVTKAAHVDDIKRQAKKVARKAEDSVEAVMQSRLIRQMGDNFNNRMEELEATAVGKVVSRKSKELKKEARRYWRRLNRELALDALGL